MMWRGHKVKDGMMDEAKMRGNRMQREVTNMNFIISTNLILCSSNLDSDLHFDLARVIPLLSHFAQILLKELVFLKTEFFTRISFCVLPVPVSDNVLSRFCRITLFAVAALIPPSLSKCLSCFNSLSNCSPRAEVSQPILHIN